MIDLTLEQRQAVDNVKLWLLDKGSREFKLGGYAGTGKTTVVKTIIEELQKHYMIKVCAFTGKAVSVLAKKGVVATTLHSMMYDVIDLGQGRVEFALKTFLVDDPDLIICDESSMLNTKLYNDLISFKRKYLFVGDPGQLEPIGDNPNLMALPDFILATIHRQAENSPIITLANHIRNGGSMELDKNSTVVIQAKAITSPQFLEADQVIVAKNVTRQGFNRAIRKYLQRPPDHIAPEDKLIICRNNSLFGVYNGVIVWVVRIKSQTFNYWLCDVRDELGKQFELPIWKEPFINPVFQEKHAKIPKFCAYCDYGYAITCHKAQGSEWDKVLVWDEWVPPALWDMKRWRYTAITRAAKSLVYNL